MAQRARNFDLAALGDALSHSAFGEFVACFDPLSPRRAEWQRCREHAPDALAPLIDLFLLSKRVELGLLPDDIRRLAPGLVALGIAAGDGERVWMPHGLALLPVFGRWLLCQPPNPNPDFYFGDDSIGLLCRMLPRAGGQCLDLCSGPGLLALHAAGIAGHVTAVESDPDTAKLACLNAALNRLSDRVRVLEGDLFEPVPGRRFDTVIANPPMLPFPDGLAGPATGHGGCDGFRVTARILAGLSDALCETGTAQLIGTCLSDGVTPLGLDKLQADGLSLTVSILSHHALTEGSSLDALVATIAFVSEREEADVRDLYCAMLARARASHLCYVFIHACRGDGQLHIIDVARANSRGRWFKQC